MQTCIPGAHQASHFSIGISASSLPWCSYGHGLFHDLGYLTVSDDDGGIVAPQRLIAELGSPLTSIEDKFPTDRVTFRSTE